MNEITEKRTAVATDGSARPDQGSNLVALSAALLLASLLMALSASLLQFAASPPALSAVSSFLFGGVSLGLLAGACVAVVAQNASESRTKLNSKLVAGGALMSLAIILLGRSDQSFIIPGLFGQSVVVGFAVLATLITAMRRSASGFAIILVLQLGIAAAVVAMVVGGITHDATSIGNAALAAGAVAALAAAVAIMWKRSQPALR